VNSGGLCYRGSCMLLMQDELKEIVHGLWRACDLPLWIIRSGEVNISSIKHTDFLARPDVLLKALDMKCQDLPEYFMSEISLTPELSFDPKKDDEWMGSQVQESEVFPKGTIVVNLAPQLKHIVKSIVVVEECMAAAGASGEDDAQSESMLRENSDSEDADANAVRDVLDGDGGAAGKDPNASLDIPSNMKYTMCPATISSKDSVGIIQIQEMIADALNKDKAPADPVPPEGVMDCARGIADQIRALDGTITDVADRARLLRPIVDMDLRRSVPPLSRPSVSRAAPIPMENVIPAPTVHEQPISLFSDEGTRGLFQKAFPTLIHNRRFDYFCGRRSLATDDDSEKISVSRMLEHLMHVMSLSSNIWRGGGACPAMSSRTPK
jgi:hypothetical protein